MPKWTIFEFQRGLLYDKGKFARELEPGFYRYWFWQKQSITVVDMRETSQTIEAQEILTADKIGIRVTLIAQFQVTDAQKATHRVENYLSQLYQDLQLTLREAVSSRKLDELMESRESLADSILEQVAPRVTEYGLDLKRVGLKDIVLPGAVRAVFLSEMEADLKGKANLVAARHETAAARARANTAKMMQDNPNLARMQELEMLNNLASKSGNVIVLPGLERLFSRDGDKSASDESASSK
ncbi:MAG: slipin family protein [Planctomycetota bacterium]